MLKFIVTILILANIALVKSSPVQAGPSCQLCISLVQQAQALLAQNATDQAILNFFQTKLCSKLGPLQPVCNQLVVSEGPILIAELRSQNPQDICARLMLCAKQNKIVLPDNYVLPTLSETVSCEICLYAVQFIDSALGQNRTQASIVNELKVVCNVFPNQLKDQCTAFITEYGPYVAEVIAADLQPQQACRKLKFCN